MLGEEKINIERPTESYDDYGRPIKSSELFKNIVASVQPLSGQEILLLAEGDRLRHPLWIYTKFAIQVDDIVIRNGDNHKAIKVENWYRNNIGLSHYRALVYLEED